MEYLKNFDTKGVKVNVVDFEKDDDSNHHIDWVAACANLRARNYDIKEGTRHKIKMIAGKIIPAIATSTALIVGVSGMELLKYLMGVDVGQMRNSFFNLALPLFLLSEVAPPLYVEDKEYDPIMMGPVKAIPGKFSCWDHIHI
jgi:ubiquitin-activating enzyme E1